MTLRLALISTIVLLMFASAVGQVKSADEKLRLELLAMRDADQQARGACPAGNADEQIKCYSRIAETVDKPNTRRLEEIFRRSGFPDAKRVGADGVQAFYLILQHSDSLVLKQKCLNGITRAFKAKMLSAWDYANFTDRLLLRLGKPQVYGAHFDFKDGKLVMGKTKDIKNLDRRRKEIGLPPIAEYAKMLKEGYKMEVVTFEEK